MTTVLIQAVPSHQMKGVQVPWKLQMHLGSLVLGLAVNGKRIELVQQILVPLLKVLVADEGCSQSDYAIINEFGQLVLVPCQCSQGPSVTSLNVLDSIVIKRHSQPELVQLHRVVQEQLHLCSGSHLLSALQQE